MKIMPKVILSALIAAVVISLLWLVIPITPVWVISYVFALVAIIGIATSFTVYARKVMRVPQGHAFPISAATYAVINVIFSAVTVFFDYNGNSFHSTWYAIIHVAIFAFFVIRIIMLLAGAEHIDKVGERAEQKHEELNKDKSEYWK